MARKDHNGKRVKRDSFSKRTPDLGFYYIVTDTTKTEKNYLNGLRSSIPKELQSRLVITVIQTDTDKLVQAAKEGAAKEVQYRQPWIVFDRDQVPGFDKIIENAEREGVKVGWSNPCIEVWFCAYFGKMESYISSTQCCESFSKLFFSRTGVEYEKSDKNIYSLLTKYGNESQAIKMAASRMHHHIRSGNSKPSAMCPGTTLYLLVEEIRNKCNQKAE